MKIVNRIILAFFLIFSTTFLRAEADTNFRKHTQPRRHMDFSSPADNIVAAAVMSAGITLIAVLVTGTSTMTVSLIPILAVGFGAGVLLDMLIVDDQGLDSKMFIAPAIVGAIMGAALVAAAVPLIGKSGGNRQAPISYIEMDAEHLFTLHGSFLAQYAAQHSAMLLQVNAQLQAAIVQVLQQQLLQQQAQQVPPQARA